MKRVEVRIEGVSPLLIRCFTTEAQLEATSSSRSSISNDSKSPREEAEENLYLDEQKRSGIPQPNLLRSIIDAGKYFKIGRSKVTTQKSSLIPAAVCIEQGFILIEHEDPWRVDTRPVRIPATGGRILRYRPRYEDWALSFTVEFDDKLVSMKLLREIVDVAGSRIGLGDFRPDTKGPFGRFKVTHWRKAA